MLLCVVVCRAVAACLILAGALLAQQKFDSSQPNPLPEKNTCNPWKFQPPANEYTFQERACLQASRLLNPSMAIHAGFAAGMGQWRNSPNILHEDLDEFGRRYGAFYARHAAQDAGEFIAGYLNHEDPTPKPSNLNGFWNRTRAAMLSVVQIRDQDGSIRPALIPIAGSLGSGLTSMPLYNSRNSLDDGFRRSGLVYSGYFATAFFREFKPEFTSLAYRALHHKKLD